MQTSSGDLLGDRRFAYAQALLETGDVVAAIDLLEQVLALVPAWTPALMALALAEERRGDRDRAIAALARAAAGDEAGLFGARLHLARLQGGSEPMPERYVAALFDDYAPRFDKHLLEGLGYRGPAVILDALSHAGGPATFAHVLDLGCGTGLMGVAIRAQAQRLDGLDLSPAMVEQARRKGVYDGLTVGAIADGLVAQAPGSLNLIVAADVFVYLGTLDAVLSACARALCTRGTLAFTVQAGEGPAPTLGDDLRFAHSADYLTQALAAAGFASVFIAPASTRREVGRDVPGLVIVARTP